MFKAIKDNKIIAVSDNDDISEMLNKDSVVEDTEHSAADYVQHNGEFLLKSEAPKPTHEEVSKAREAYRVKMIDTKTLERMRKTANKTWTEEDEAAYLALDKAVTAYIEEHFPYFD